MERNLLDLHDDYHIGLLDRREFLNRLALVAGGNTAAYALIPWLENNDLFAETIPKDDSRIASNDIRYQGASGDLRASLVLPKGAKKIPGVVVIHEAFGLTPHIKDVARRLGMEGFMAIAPDAFTSLGKLPKDLQEARAMIQQLDSENTIQDYVAAAKYLQTHPRSNGNVGVVGFCWGGGMANQVAVKWPDLKAAVPFYGGQPATEDVPGIKASLLLHYAGDDDRVNAGIPTFEEALKKASIDYTLYMYEGAQHGFHNDTLMERYNQEAARLAWKRTIDFFKKKLSP
ncbi:MAG: dienelactone hydrolase family protein [Deltaproteobacteria bacterium]|nr:dienelactone hydrolase family protein [Deltaproteobacteria bacterium]